MFIFSSESEFRFMNRQWSSLLQEKTMSLGNLTSGMEIKLVELEIQLLDLINSFAPVFTTFRLKSTRRETVLGS